MDLTARAGETRRDEMRRTLSTTHIRDPMHLSTSSRGSTRSAAIVYCNCYLSE